MSHPAIESGRAAVITGGASGIGHAGAPSRRPLAARHGRPRADASTVERYACLRHPGNGTGFVQLRGRAGPCARAVVSSCRRRPPCAPRARVATKGPKRSSRVLSLCLCGRVQARRCRTTGRSAIPWMKLFGCVMTSPTTSTCSKRATISSHSRRNCSSASLFPMQRWTPKPNETC